MLKQLCKELEELFKNQENTKDLKQCGQSVYELFESTRRSFLEHSKLNLNEKASALVDYSHENILLYPFKEVPDYWRRMLIDAGLLRALIELSQQSDLSRVLWDLDVCCVVSGSPERYELATRLLDCLQSELSSKQTEHRGMLPRTERLPARVEYPIERLKEIPSFEWFLSHCNQERPKPVIIPRGVLEHWPASERWRSLDYLWKTASDRVVPVEIGRSYTAVGWRQEMMRFSEFIERFILSEKDGMAYLAQHDLFYQVPRLERDILIPDYCYIEPRLTDLYEARPREVIKNAWFGPKGTVSPLHHDPYHNLLAQVVGSKYLRLYCPGQSEHLYPREGMMNNTSQVDVENINQEEFPRFKEAHYMECILKEGEILYIPPKWWHFVKSLETSFNVSLWF